MDALKANLRYAEIAVRDESEKLALAERPSSAIVPERSSTLSHTARTVFSDTVSSRSGSGSDGSSGTVSGTSPAALPSSMYQGASKAELESGETYVPVHDPHSGVAAESAEGA